MKENGSAQRFKLRYGITVEQYEQMVAEQNGLCAICDKPPSGNGHNSKLHVDHDHTTGKVRKLLCHSCNHGLGNFKDDPQSLERAARYIRSN